MAFGVQNFTFMGTEVGKSVVKTNQQVGAKTFTETGKSENENTEEKPEPKKFIKWIDFNASSAILAEVQKAHKKLLEKGIEDIGACELLAYVALKNGNSFNLKTDRVNLGKLVTELMRDNREPMDRYVDNKYYKYYVESYHAILDGVIDPDTGDVTGFHPIAKGFWYSCSDDFGNSRSYGFKRRHLGHDLFGGVGTPIIAVEGGTITELGWNRFGGWRVGIRSDDTKRYYYYAHLRKDKPFGPGLEKGGRVEAGQVIGYLGRTGYSKKENVNMANAKPHLHFGLQIIFDKSQEDGNGEIWVDVNPICRFLSKNRAVVKKDEDTGHYVRVFT